MLCDERGRVPCGWCLSWAVGLARCRCLVCQCEYEADETLSVLRCRHMYHRGECGPSHPRLTIPDLLVVTAAMLIGASLIVGRYVVGPGLAECISTWLSSNKTCPVCKHDISTPTEAATATTSQ